MVNDMKKVKEIKFEFIEHISVLSEDKRTGWRKELNLVSWNNKMPKYDIRSWSPDYTEMSKEVTLSKDELSNLRTTIDTLVLK